METAKNKFIELYPSNWLYNAGVIGFFNIFLKWNQDTELEALEKGRIELSKLKEFLSEKNDHDNKPPILNQIPHWHFRYLSETYRKYYGSVEGIVRTNFQRANTSKENRSNLLKKIIEKEKQFTKHNLIFNNQEQKIDFSDAYKEVNEVWKNAFARKPIVSIDKAITSTINLLGPFENAIQYRRAIAYLFSSGSYYQNYYNPNWYNDVDKFIAFFSPEKILHKEEKKEKCDNCLNTAFQVYPLDLQMESSLFPSHKGFPNSFWNCMAENTANFCGVCRFFILHQHLGLIQSSSRSEIFINAPSFKIMYHLNRFLKEISGGNKMELRSKRELLAMSVIEYATRIKTTLGQWSTMNIEIVTKTRDEIDFFATPNDVMQLLSNRNIASQLKNIGEFSILNLVLDRKYSRLTDVGYRLMQEAMKNRNRNTEYINKWIYSKSNHQRIGEVAQQIFKLYALIEERIKHVNKFSKNKEYAN